MCIGILLFLGVFLPYVASVLFTRMHVWDWCYWCSACMFLCGDVYSASVCWRDVELWVLMFCIVLICCRIRDF
jgi:hypothetical protein